VHLLEPTAPDSLMQWGLMNSILEPKEGAEWYIFEAVAQKMMAEDPALRKEFEEKLASDPEFAKNSWARLGFFYDRSPYRDRHWRIYPIGRLNTAEDLAALPQ
jgi:hypothetical protein